MTNTPEAVRYRKTATITATQWWKLGDHPAVVAYDDYGEPTQFGWVNTLEGGHIVTPGDWIATGVQGEHWPIKPDVFAASYVPEAPTGNPYIDLDVGSITVPIGYVRKMVECLRDSAEHMAAVFANKDLLTDRISFIDAFAATVEENRTALALGQSVITAFDQEAERG